MVSLVQVVEGVGLIVELEEGLFGEQEVGLFVEQIAGVEAEETWSSAGMLEEECCSVRRGAEEEELHR